jgi:hypothetical protein
MNALMCHFEASMSDFDASISTLTRRSRDERVDVQFEASMSDFDASISTSTRRSRDEYFDVPVRSVDVRLRRIDLDIDVSISR